MKTEYKKKFIFLAICMVLAVLLFLIEYYELGGIATAVAFGVLYIVAGYEVFVSAAKKLLRGKPFSEETLMSIAAIGAFCIGSRIEGAAVLIFYLVGETFSEMASAKARKSVEELMKICPETAVIVTVDGEKTVSPKDVKIGDMIAVRAGEKIPIDGMVVSGSASIDTASVTGESIPLEAAEGSSVYAGCICLDGGLKIRATALYGDSTVANMLRLTEIASERKAKTERFITRFAAIYTPIVVGLAVVYAVAVPLLLGGGWVSCIKNAINFLVVCCPCALVLSVPLAFFCGCGKATESGVLVKGGVSMETLAKAKTVVLDKTGTVTDGNLEVADVLPRGISKAALLKYAATAEFMSNHPIANAIKREYGDVIDGAAVEAFTELGGYGVRARVEGMHLLVGNARLMKEEGISDLPDAEGKTAVYVSANGIFRGLITLRDRIKPDAKEAVELLRKQGVRRIAIFSGDSDGAAKEVAALIGADEGIGGMLPSDKCDMLRKEKESGTVAFVGDGINDAPAIAVADVGIAMGAIGSDAAIEASDIVVMGDGLTHIGKTMEISANALRTARENIWLCLIVKGAVLAASALGYAPIWLAVIADVGAAILAVAHSVFGVGRKRNETAAQK